MPDRDCSATMVSPAPTSPPQRTMRPLIKLALLCVLPMTWPTAILADDLFTDSVAPILSRRCLSCHNETKTSGDLSIVDPRRLIDDGYIDPSDAASSHLVELIRPTAGSAQMPKDSDPLKPAEIEAITNWIDAGASIPDAFQLESSAVADRDWWSLQPIASLDAPIDHQSIDQFIDAKLSAQGLTPLPQADPVTLVRRITYDLTGLPPKPEQIDSLLSANQSDPQLAWKQLVDRLLDSPEFGEKWGQHWLDIARYAETHGYDKDQPRNNAWPYRDYVIHSFNADKPFADFAREQIAGDVLAADTSQGIIATGFLAAGPWDLIAHQEVGEGKLDGRIAKHLDRDEMATAVFNVFQSTTIQCAQCHHHKFDPIESQDYYRVHAVFAGIDRADRVHAGLSPEQQNEQQSLQRERDEIVRARNQSEQELQKQLDEKTKGDAPRIDELTQKANQFPPPPEHGFHSTIVSDPNTEKWVEIDLGSAVTLDQIELIACYDDFNQIGSGFGFPVRFKVQASGAEALTDQNAWTLLDASDQDFPNPGSLPVKIDAAEQPIRIIRVTATKLAERKDDFILALAEIRAIGSDTHSNLARNAQVNVSDHIPPNARWAPKYLVDEKYHRIALVDSEQTELRQLTIRRNEVIQSLTTSTHRDQIRQWNNRIAAIDERLKTFPPGKLVFAAATDFPNAGQFKPTKGTVRPIHFLHRGDLKSPGERMLPGAPKLWETASTQFFDQEPHNEADARAALAHYVTQHDNPLLWRSMANRIWQWTFGSPLVSTPNDFGRMGSRPTHPELLDALAAQLRDDPKQSIKSIVRMLVCTQAYRRASFTADNDSTITANAKLDANNKLLWRFNRRRLTAEEFRDTVLSMGDVLQIDKRGGPSFKDFVVEHPQHSPHYEYGLHDPNDPASHRRTIYRFVVRSQPQPMLTTLDCADPSISIARRDESTTALQALAQWNNRLIEVMSKHFAQRITQEANRGVDPVNIACRLAWGRNPSRAEHQLLIDLIQTQGAETACRVILNTSAMIYID